MGSHVAFSSYAGMLVSTDDFYVLGSGLAMVQTSLNVLNTSIYDGLTPQSLLAWQRVRLANVLSTTARQNRRTVLQQASAGECLESVGFATRTPFPRGGGACVRVEKPPRSNARRSQLTPMV